MEDGKAQWQRENKKLLERNQAEVDRQIKNAI